MIRLRDVYYRYGAGAGDGAGGLHGITADLPAGAFIGVMGGNGSGKTTLALCLRGILHPTGGSITYEAPLARGPADVGVVFQNPDNQFIAPTVEREVAFGLENAGVPGPAMRRHVAETLGRFDLTALAGRTPAELSGGEKQKVACAAVMVTAPRVLILDEVTTFLDPSERRRLLSLVRGEFLRRRADGFSILMITQDPEEMIAADRVLVLHRGRLALDDSPARVFCQVQTLQTLGVGIPVDYLLGPPDGDRVLRADGD